MKVAKSQIKNLFKRNDGYGNVEEELTGSIVLIDPQRVSILSEDEREIIVAGNLLDMCVAMAFARNYSYKRELQKVIIVESMFSAYSQEGNEIMMEQLIMTISKMKEINENLNILIVKGMNLEVV